MEINKNIINKKNNGIIAFWKFMFCLLIIYTHVAQQTKTDAKISFICGSIAVEFFFLVSGYLMTKKAMKIDLNDSQKIGQETFEFILKKIKSFFPYFLVTYIIALPVYCIIDDYNKTMALNTIFDLLFLEFIFLLKFVFVLLTIQFLFLYF